MDPDPYADQVISYTCLKSKIGYFNCIGRIQIRFFLDPNQDTDQIIIYKCLKSKIGYCNPIKSESRCEPSFLSR